MSKVDFSALKDIDPKIDALISGYFREFENIYYVSMMIIRIITFPDY